MSSAKEHALVDHRHQRKRADVEIRNRVGANGFFDAAANEVEVPLHLFAGADTPADFSIMICSISGRASSAFLTQAPILPPELGASRRSCSRSSGSRAPPPRGSAPWRQGPCAAERSCPPRLSASGPGHVACSTDVLAEELLRN